MIKRVALVACLALVGIGLTCHSMRTAPADNPRLAAWAEPVDSANLSNLHRVSPTLLRGAQPTAAGFAELEQMGVHTVLSLRGFHSDDIPKDVALQSEHISFKAWHPEDEDVVRFLRIVNDPAQQPVFVHCQWGADRTGMMCAIYRIACNGWTKDEALAEMTRGGFGFHPEWTNLIEYVRKLDIDRIAKQAGL